MKDEYKTLSDAQRTKLGNKYDPINLFRETYNYDVWFENVELTDTTWRICGFMWHAATRRWWKIKRRNKIKNLDFKQIVNQTSNVIGANKS